MEKLKQITVPEVEAAIGRDSGQWVGNCYAIACQILAAGLVDGRAAYGHYHGPIEEGTVFYGKAPLVRHGWIETDDGGIIDPTRWVFEAASPYIYYTPQGNPDYDEGGQQFQLSMMRPRPDYDPRSPQYSVPEKYWPVFSDFLGIDKPRDHQISREELFWVANLPVVLMWERGAFLLEALEAMNLQVIMPIDNQTIIRARANK